MNISANNTILWEHLKHLDGHIMAADLSSLMGGNDSQYSTIPKSKRVPFHHLAPFSSMMMTGFILNEAR